MILLFRPLAQLSSSNAYSHMERSLQRTVCSSAMQQQRKILENSLLGPEFVDYLDPPTFPSYELAAIATDISSVA
ncbi:hypothetical protein F2Q69_00032127 [Brassica cretica]|uniref:Uncharacterized protein n=1 Tax=Brassica cretica TaxID=69181 RepID=A0A8S9SAE8_BRACR|nr:hypothetical protein F2Q69_00032127 [Brassica cretica]